MKWVNYISLTWATYLACLGSVLGQSKFSLSLNVAPAYRYANTTFSSISPVMNGGLPVDVRVRQTGQGYSVGFLARYALSNQMSITTGLSRNFIKYPVPTITTIPDLSATPDDVQITGIVRRNRNYQIPVWVNFQSSAKRLSPYFSVGGLLNFPAITVLENGSKGKSPNQKTQIQPTLGAGIIYQANPRFSLVAQPTFTYILPNGTFINYLNYQVGLQTQLMYHL